MVLLLVLWLYTPSQGQTTQDSTVSNKALNFGIGGSSGIALQYWLSNNQAVVGGIGISSGTQLSSPTNNSVFDPFADINIGVFARYHYYFWGRRQFAPFGAIGGNFSWRQNKFPAAFSHENSAYIGLSMGLECFILPWLSISAQYGIGVNYTSYITERPASSSLPSYYSYIFRMDLNNSGVLVSIYF